MVFNIAADIAKLTLFIVCAYALLGAYARRRRPQWTEHLTKRRLAVLGMLTLAVGGIQLIEDVVAKESMSADEAILWFIRDRVPAALNGFFAEAAAQPRSSQRSTMVGEILWELE